MILKLKQINLLKQSDFDESLRLSLQRSDSPSHFESDNLYELVFIKDNYDGIMGTNLMAVSLTHSNAIMGEMLTKFIAMQMIRVGQPSLTFTVDVQCELALDMENSVYCYKIADIQDISADYIQLDTHFVYGDPMNGRIEYLTEHSLLKHYIDKVFMIQFDQSSREEARSVYGNCAWNTSVKIHDPANFTTNVFNNDKILVALNSYADSNTIKISDAVKGGDAFDNKRLVVFLPGISTPTFADSGTENNLYYINQISKYQVFQESPLTLEECQQMGSTVFSYIKKIMNNGDKDLVAGYVYPLSNDSGFLGNNQYGQLQCAILYCIEYQQDADNSDFPAFNLAHSLVRSTYEFTSPNKESKFVPMAMPDISSDGGTYQTSETSYIFWKSLAHIKTLHAEYLKKYEVVEEDIVAANGETATTTTNNTDPISNVNDPRLFGVNPIRETDAFKTMEKRLEQLGYMMKELNGYYYAVPKYITAVIPYIDTENQIEIYEGDTYGEICEKCKISPQDLCAANGTNFYKYDKDRKCYVGEIIKIPVANTDVIRVSDQHSMITSSPTFKIPNSNYIPAESALEIYEDLKLDDRDQLDDIVRHPAGVNRYNDDILWSPFGEHMLRIGDCTLPISPLSILINKTAQNERVATLRSRNSLQLNSGYSVETITLSLYFNGTDQINGVGYQPYEDDDELIYYRNGLRPLIAQFMKAPFLPIENELINHTYGVYSVCLQDLQMNTVPEFPHCIEVTLTLLPFDHSTYMFNEEFFEGTFCWPLFRWYYQQKMIKESATQLKPYIGNDLQLFTHKINFAGDTEDILFNPANTLIFSIPQEGALKQRKLAINELYEKKAPALFEAQHQKYWIGTNDTDGARLYLGYQQYKNFTVVKNYFPKADYPELYTTTQNSDGETVDAFTLATYGSKILQTKDGQVTLLTVEDGKQKYDLVELVATYLTIYTNTYQYAKNHYFVINGFDPRALFRALELIGDNLDTLIYTGNEATEWSFSGFDPNRYKNNIETIKTMRSVYAVNADILTTSELQNQSLAVVGGLGLLAAIGGTIMMATGVGFGIGATLLVLGTGAVIATSVAGNDEGKKMEDILSLISFKGFNGTSPSPVWDEMWMADSPFEDYVQGESESDKLELKSAFAAESPDGTIFAHIHNNAKIKKLLDHEPPLAVFIDKTVISNATTNMGIETVDVKYEIVPSAIPMLDATVSGDAVGKAEVEAYKEEMENLRYVAHQTEEDIPTKTIVLADIIVQSCSASITNRFAPLQTQKQETPTYQFLGGSDIVMKMSFATKSRVALNELCRALKESQYLAREYRIAIVNGVLDFHHPFFSLLGAKSALIENVSIETSDESAEVFNVVLDIVSFDKTQKRRETINKDGFGLVFDDEKDWKLYQKLKRSNSDFEYSNVDLMLKEAELYPDLELPTYYEVNEFLQKHPISDRFGTVFNYFPNTTNCKFVDPDFYVRCEETLRDYITSKLDQGGKNGMVLYDQYNNSLINTCPSKEEQLLVQNGESEVEKTDADGKVIQTKMEEIHLKANQACENAIKNAAGTMVAMSALAEGGELSASAYYYSSINPTYHHQTPEEKQMAAEAMEQWRNVIDIVTDTSTGKKIDSYVDENGKTIDLGNERRELMIDMNRIGGAVWEFKMDGWHQYGQEYAEAAKRVRYAQYHIPVFDKGQVLKSVRCAKNEAITCDTPLWVYASDQSKMEKSYLPGYNLEGTASFLVTLIDLYIFISFARPEHISIIDPDQQKDPSVLSELYIIIDETCKDKLQSLFADYKWRSASEKEYSLDAQSWSNISANSLNAIDLLWLAYAIYLKKDNNPDLNEVMIQDCLDYISNEFNLVKQFEDVGIYLYRKGYEKDHVTRGIELLNETMGQYEGVDKRDNSKTMVEVDPKELAARNAQGEIVDVEDAIKASNEFVGAQIVHDYEDPNDERSFDVLPQFTIFPGDLLGDFANEHTYLETVWKFQGFKEAIVSNFRNFDDQGIIFSYRIDIKLTNYDKGNPADHGHINVIIPNSSIALGATGTEREYTKNIILYALLLYYASNMISDTAGKYEWEGQSDEAKKFVYDFAPLVGKGAPTVTNLSEIKPVTQFYLYVNTSLTNTCNFLAQDNKRLRTLIEQFGSNDWRKDDEAVQISAEDKNTLGIEKFENKQDFGKQLMGISLEILKEFESNYVYWIATSKLTKLYIPEEVNAKDGGEVRLAESVVISVMSVNNRLASNLKVLQQQYLFRTSFNDMIKYDCRGRLVRAFPSYHMIIVDEGDQALFYSMWDNFYEYNSIVSIDVYKDRRIVADTAVIQLTNIYHNLSSKDTDFTYDDYDYTFFDAVQFGATERSRAYWTKQWSLWFNLPDATMIKAQQQKVASIVLSPGARIHLRVGYGSDAYNLPVLFNGVITEVDCSEIMTIAAQGDGVELTNKLQVGAGETTDPGAFECPLEPRMIIGDMFTSRGSCFKNIVNKVSDNTLYKSNPLGIAHFGQNEEASSMIAWESAPIFFGWWSRITNHETETNNYGPSLINVYAGGSARSLSKWAYTDLTARHVNFSGEKFAWKWDIFNWFGGYAEVNEVPSARIYLFDMTVNDVCQMLAACCPDYICAVAPFELRSTLFFGRPSWGYVKEYAYMYKWDPQLLQLIRQRAGSSRQSFSQSRFYTSYTDIISNKITATSEYMKTNIIGIYNEKHGAKQTAVVQIDSDLDDDCQTTGTVHLPLKADDFLGLDLGSYNYFHQGKYAETAAISELRNQAGHMYQGELVVLGDPSVKPHDKMYIQDSYTDMHGLVGVRSVHHALSAETGLISSVTPDLLAVHDDEEGVESTMWIAQIAAETVALVSSLAIAKCAWKMFLRGPVAERVKQLGAHAIVSLMQQTLGNYTESTALKTLFELGDGDELVRILNLQGGAASDEIVKYGKNLIPYIQDRQQITRVLATYADDVDLTNPTIVKEISGKLKNLQTVTKNADGCYDMTRLSKMVLNEDDIVRLHAITKISGSTTDDALRAGFASISKISMEIDGFTAGKFASRGIGNKTRVILNKKQVSSLESIATNLKGMKGVDNVDDLTAVIAMAKKGEAIDGVKLVHSLNGYKTAARAKALDNVVDITKVAKADDIAKACTQFGAKYGNSVFASVADDALNAASKAGQAVKASRNSASFATRFKSVADRVDDVADVYKVLNKADDVKDVIKVGKSITGSMRTAIVSLGTAVAPGIGTLISIGIEIAFSILTEMAFEFYFRWKRRRQALILMPMIYRSHTFIAGLDGHKGCVLGDQPGVIDTMLMGQGFCSGLFNVLNCITGSNKDYANQTLSAAYEDWKTQVDAWDLEYTAEDYAALGIEVPTKEEGEGN